MEANKSRIVVIEGLDGCGKSTQFDKISEYYCNKGVKIKPISFPDYNNPSSSLVKMYLSGEICKSASEVNAYAASSFYAVDRYASFKQFWEKDYNDGAMILAARYVTSNCIYQMTKLDKSQWDDYLDWLFDYEYNKLELPKPDMVIFLDMPIEISQKLMSGRYNNDESKKDIHEANIAYLYSCRETALYSASKLGWKIVNCSDGTNPFPVDKIFQEIIKLIENL